MIRDQVTWTDLYEEVCSMRKMFLWFENEFLKHSSVKTHANKEICLKIKSIAVNEKPHKPSPHRQYNK